MALHWETITPFMRQVLRTIGQSSLCPRFYLAGGTALALRLGHRHSADLGLFSAVDQVLPATDLLYARFWMPPHVNTRPIAISRRVWCVTWPALMSLIRNCLCPGSPTFPGSRSKCSFGSRHRF